MERDPVRAQGPARRHRAGHRRELARGRLVQLVTCGELALGGSSSCDMRGALATAVKPDGTFSVVLTVGEPSALPVRGARGGRRHR
ncbi:hypothetical protein ACFQZ4_12450 [Catellatospora coxensis]